MQGKVDFEIKREDLSLVMSIPPLHSPEFGDPTSVERVLDINNLQNAIKVLKERLGLAPQKYTPLIDPIGMILGFQGGPGSGILLTKTRFLTAGHLIEGIANSINRVSIRFRYVFDGGVPLEAVQYGVKSILEWPQNGLDFGLLEVYPIDKTMQVKPLPKSKRRLANGSATVGTDIFILGHPEGRRMEGDLGEIVSMSNGPLQFYHNVDTEGGNSGSPVFQQGTNKLIGIHRGFDPNLPPQSPNRGVLLSAIYQASHILTNPQ